MHRPFYLTKYQSSQIAHYSLPFPTPTWKVNRSPRETQVNPTYTRAGPNGSNCSLYSSIPPCCAPLLVFKLSLAPLVLVVSLLRVLNSSPPQCLPTCPTFPLRMPALVSVDWPVITVFPDDQQRPSERMKS